jgi:segregation and condensation protein B
VTTSENELPSAPGSGPGAFSEEEIAAVTAAPMSDPEVDEADPADIDEQGPDLENSFEKLLSKSKKLSAEHVRTVIESILFVSEAPLSVDQLYEATAIDREKIVAALEKLGGKLREGVSGVVLHEVAGGYQLRTDPGSAEYVRRYLRVKPQRLTRAAVETLAIIAYRQPVTRPEVEDIRGVDCGAVVKALLDRKLIKILGKREEVGRPILYGTTREFLEFFALKDLAALPTLREFHELTEESQEIVEKEAPSKPVAAGTVESLADPSFRQRLEEDNQGAEEALAELEEAMTQAEGTVKVAAAVLNPPGAPTPPPEEETTHTSPEGV